jgi:hypothetical protein
MNAENSDLEKKKLTQQENFDSTKYKLAAFDLDGTILDHGKMSDMTRDTLKALHESGVMVVFATGRHYKMVLKVIEILPFVRYVITAGGAQVMDLQTNEVISFEPLDTRTAQALTRAITAQAKGTSIYVEDCILIPIKFLFTPREQISFKSIKREIRKFFIWARIVLFPNWWVRNPQNVVVKLNAYFAHSEQGGKFLNEINSVYAVEALTTQGFDVEINKKGVHKGWGLKKLCDHLNIQPEETIVFGDSANDIEIMKCAGYAVAMGNANDDVKAVADCIAPSITEDGAAQVLLTLFGLGPIKPEVSP